jgi:hypothetical protein
MITIGAGCAATSSASTKKLCYAVQNDPDALMLSLEYDTSAGEDAYADVPATLTFTDSGGNDPFVVLGVLRDGVRFVYPTGDYFEQSGEELIGHEPNLRDGFAKTIDGLRATAVPCES